MCVSGTPEHQGRVMGQRRRVIRPLEVVAIVGRTEQLPVRAMNRLLAEKETQSDRACKDLACVEKEIAGIIAAIKQARSRRP